MNGIGHGVELKQFAQDGVGTGTGALRKRQG